MAGTLYVVRHGQTLFNERKIIQGLIDSPLTAEGIEQARRVGRFIAHQNLTFDHAYASTLACTHQTLELITSMPFEREAGLCEWSFGEYEGERAALMPPQPWGDYFVQFGGEGEREFSDRINETLTNIMNRPGHKQVFVVSHGSAGFSFMKRWRDAADRRYTDVPGNCSMVRYGFDGTGFVLEEIFEQEDMRRVLGE
ncbi:histidine phosphatase family protein [Collinsella sp. AGMB00827]|uniref:Histidine phosphatase family protein n=1 Tax=Collinsella ureilytica TaxID=2869515 RepID=A0ABS7MHU6_9ACTN|nr:histidine phosphatase family protein [Collinsella urealyticum]MBY4796931.1 histidine phosphatase family protein [Collinsella urealyticum]